MSKKEIFKYLLETNASISIDQIMIAMMASLVLALFMYFVYRKTYTGVVYSKSFNQTLVLMAIIITMVMMIIGGNLALSLGMVGSLSVIRFRTAIKEPRDMAFLFWSIAIGLSCGAEMYGVAVVGSVVIAVILFVFKLDIYEKNTYLAVVRGEGINTSEIEKILNNAGGGYKLRMQNVSMAGLEITYEVRVKSADTAGLVEKLYTIDGVAAVNIVTYTGEVLG